ncbi:ATP-binding cassette domain-containing protein [Leminorella grimontii]|uniref:ATP-binding cassette domain-containing protein n=1 Tax=Leminorella grimontii TaxID=82981 RepID=UPI00322087D3
MTILEIEASPEEQTAQDIEINALGAAKAYLTLGDGLAAAADALSVPVARWEWQSLAQTLTPDAPVDAWFELAARALGVEVLPCEPEHQPVKGGVYLLQARDGWGVLTADRHLSPAPFSELAQRRKAWRVVVRDGAQRLSWRALFRLGEQEGKTVSRLLWSTLIINLLAIVMPLYLNAVYDRIIPGHADSSLWTLSAAVVLALLVEYVFRVERVKTGGRFLSSMQQRLEPALIKDLIHTVPSQDNKWGRGVLEAMNNWNRFRMQCLGLFSSSALDLAFSVLYFVVIAAIAGWLVLVPLFIFICAIVRVVLFYLETERLPSYSAQVPFSTGTLDNYRATVAYKAATLQFLRANEKAQQAEQNRFILQNRCSASLMALMNFQTVLAVICAFYLVQSGGMSPAGLFVTVVIAGRLGQPIFSLMQLLPSLQKMRRSMAEINQLVEEQHKQDSEEPVGYHGPNGGWSASQLDFNYHPSLPCINRINLHISPKERVAIVGGAGAGKSTLLKLMLGILMPNGGHVTWDGMLLSARSADAVRRGVHYAWQDGDVIGETVFDYLSLDNPLPESAEEILSVLKKANLTGLMPFLNQGLNSRWQSLAVPLTSLQKQQLALARLLLSKRSCCILDNPSAHLDPASESVLIEHLKQRADAGEGMIIATDRANLVALVDRIVMLSGGSVVFDGNKEDFSRFLTSRREGE